MEHIRLATPEEVERIKDEADLTSASAVYAMGEGDKTMTAVLRTCTELDPVFLPASTSDVNKYMFLWGMQNFLRLSGCPEVYFNVLADEATARWRELLIKDGAEPVSKAPEVRFKKSLR